MRRSAERILTTHAGSLARPEALREMLLAKDDVRLPDGKILIPGVVGHASDFVEHPELVADRLVRYASAVGRDNVIAGTDCGLGPRVGHPRIAWAKFEALVEGARLATRELWR